MDCSEDLNNAIWKSTVVNTCEKYNKIKYLNHDLYNFGFPKNWYFSLFLCIPIFHTPEGSHHPFCNQSICNVCTQLETEDFDPTKVSRKHAR